MIENHPAYRPDKIKDCMERLAQQGASSLAWVRNHRRAGTESKASSPGSKTTGADTEDTSSLACVKDARVGLGVKQDRAKGPTEQDHKEGWELGYSKSSQQAKAKRA